MNTSSKEVALAIECLEAEDLKNLSELDLESACEGKKKAFWNVRLGFAGGLVLWGLVCLVMFQLSIMSVGPLITCLMCPAIFGLIFTLQNHAQYGGVADRMGDYELLSDDMRYKVLEVCLRSERADKYRSEVLACGRNLRVFDLSVMENFADEDESKKRMDCLEKNKNLLTPKKLS
jgi:hypothetical protein